MRSAKEADIPAGQSAFLDIDLEGEASPARLADLTRFLRVADEYFTGLGLRRPVRASSGNRGSHLLFAYPRVLVAECPDLADRLRLFRSRFVRAVQQDLSRLEARVDAGTLGLRAMVKVYGTGKVGGAISRFYGGARFEDQALREYLLSLPSRPPTTTTGDVVVVPGPVLPAWFTSLLAVDGVVRNLYHGNGKPAGTDRTTSGYDYSLVRHLIAAGHDNPDDLGTILSLRPGGGAHKGLSYVSRTVNTALHRAAVNG